MARPEVQDSSPALGAIVVHGDHFYRWAPEVVSCSAAPPVVPLSVAEKLATALAEIKRVAAIKAPPVSDEVPAKAWRIAFDALAEFRAAYPREENQP